MDLSRYASVLNQETPPVRPWLLSLVAGFLFAILAIVTLPSPINHFGTIDPLLYQSYIRDYQELIELYGYTYYSSRIAWIYPAHWAQVLLGDIPGYFAIRFLLLGGAATGFSILVGRFCRWQFSVYAAALFCFFPLIQRAFAHDYVDGAAIAYSVMGLACVFTAKPRAFVQHLFGGVFFALAFNAYPLSAIVPMTLAIPWFILRKDAGDELNIGAIFAAFIGAAAAYGLIFFALSQAFAAAGKPYELVPLSTISSLSGGGAAAWSASRADMLMAKGEFFRAYPVFLLGALAVAAWGLRRATASQTGDLGKERIILVLAVLCGGVLAFYLLMHFVMRSGVIYYPWAYIFAIPACLLVSVYLLDAATPRRHVGAVCAAGIVLLASLALSQDVVRLLDAARPVWLGLGLLIVLAGLAWTGGRPAALIVAAIASLLLFPLGFYSATGACGYEPRGSTERLPDTYVACMRQDDAYGAERDMRAGIFTLLADVKRTVPLNDPPGLWYANGTGYADVVGSAFLWMYSRVGSVEKGDPGMPAINAFAREKIEGYDYLVLIGRSRAELDAGKAALAAEGHTVKPLLQRRVGGRDFSFMYEIVKKGS